METLFSFLIRASIVIMLFYVVYWLFLRNETIYHANRWFFIFALISSVLLPIFPLRYTLQAEPIDNTIVFQALNDTFKNIQPVHSGNSETPSSIGLMSILTVVYVTGAFLVLSRLVIQTGILVHLLSRSKISSVEGIRVAENHKYEIPFSFFNIAFINSEFIKQADLPYIISHEKVHIREFHWLDLLLIDLLTVIFWFNPFIWFFKRSIRQNHEYLADKGVIARGHSEYQYRALLINQAMGVRVIGPTNCLNYSLNQNRFKMMKKKKTPRLRSLKLLLTLPVLATMIFAFAEPKPILQEPHGNKNNENELNSQKLIEVTGKVVDEQGKPIPGVNIVMKGTTTGTTTRADGTFELEVTPGKKLVLSYVGKETIVDDLSGITTNKQIHREYTMKDGVVHIDRDKYFSKKPASKNRQKKDHSVASSGDTSVGDNKVIFIVVEDMPTYPGGFYELGKYVKGMEKKLSREQNLNGNALIGFTVDENGKVSDIKILKKDNDAVARYAVDIVSGMRDWTPGKQRGTPVPVKFTLPVEF